MHRLTWLLNSLGALMSPAVGVIASFVSVIRRRPTVCRHRKGFQAGGRGTGLPVFSSSCHASYCLI